MTQPLTRPPRKNPLARTRQPTRPPQIRSRRALGLTAAAALGRFELQVCQDCQAVQYPPREVCRQCLSERLRWLPVNPRGRLLAVTTLHHSNDLYFRERLPWRIGTVQMAAGPAVVAHVHGDCKEADIVRLALKLDRSGQAVMIALPDEATPNMEDDKTLRETACDPKFRRVLVTDGKTPLGMATIRALLDAQASMVFAGDPDVWRRSAEFDALCEDERVLPQDMNITDTDSVERISRSIGGKVDILINTADYQRDGGVLFSHGMNTAREAMEVNCMGLMRLAQHFGPGMFGRAADGVNNAVAWVNVLSIYAHVNLPARGLWSASQAAALSVAQCLRQEFMQAGVRVINVFPGPLDHEWEQLTPPPRVAPGAVAAAIVRALQEGTEDVYVGDVAKEFLDRWRANPKGLEREL
ncbi:SDR family NAD(P)-dependent oxidoreductase [Allopusillimonas soli]|uniref:SDR family NAD(P)-dependent oxidoreductase n=1 Tax=Allopusillimonas soli TaxID=659016 RepID=A0A853FB40_9BURK|nr:SDR family NAD(P)-dependent oxidoreductase [Allopusillimonas soli]NYT37313.1 SDR family NAD(P)-dependent oxidoreductase [Allopusillimonas soli]TEA74697.1 SDR family NAD(P)-dependent oxidoreductase [Allopusillimonas soli]